MADLLDIAPATAVEVVKITGGERIKVQGLHVNAIAAIVARFPELVALLGGLAAAPTRSRACSASSAQRSARSLPPAAVISARKNMKKRPAGCWSRIS